MVEKSEEEWKAIAKRYRVIVRRSQRNQKTFVKQTAKVLQHKDKR